MVLTAHTADAILCLLSAILCLHTGTVLLLYAAGKKAQHFIGLSAYLAFGVGMTTIWLIYSQIIYHVPYFYRTGNIFLLLYMPLSWLYIRTSVNQRRLSAWHLLHLLPALLYTIDFFPLFFAFARREAIHHSGRPVGPEPFASFSAGLVVTREITDTDADPANDRLLDMADPAVGFEGSNAAAEEPSLEEVAIYIQCSPITYFFYLHLSFLASGGHGYVWATSIPAATTTFLSTFTLFLSPKILYNARGKILVPRGIKSKLTFNAAFVRKLDAQLEALMQDQKPFLNADYTLKELADALELPVYRLSSYINQVTGKNFSDYLNRGALFIAWS